MKKLLALMMSATLMTSFAGCAGNSAKPAEETTDTKQMPSKFDLRNADGKNYVTPVKSQRWGDCWTFAMAGAAETAYLYANGLGVPAGETNDKVNFSEKYIAWYMFHGITKDDAAKGKVRSSQAGEVRYTLTFGRHCRLTSREHPRSYCLCRLQDRLFYWQGPLKPESFHVPVRFHRLRPFGRGSVQYPQGVE